MTSRGILSRIRDQRRNLNEVESIVEHLRVLLNTHMGDSYTAPDFGVPDFTDTIHALPDRTSSFLDSVRKVVLSYEPRLRNVTVRLVPSDNPLEMAFEIAARLDDEQRTLLRLQSSIGPGGHFNVRG